MSKRSRKSVEQGSRRSQSTWAIGLGLGLVTMLAAPAIAATPTPYLQDSTIVGSGRTITATDVPVQTSTAGMLVYKDVTIQLNAATDGNLTIDPGYPKVVAAISPILDHFVAGNYAGPPTFASVKFLITVNGPGVSAGGATAWSLTTAKGADCTTYPQSATWYTGPIASNPLAARLKKAGITSGFYSYGIVGGTASCSASAAGNPFFFQIGALIGISQVEGSLTMVSFTGNADLPIPLAEITYTLLP